MEGRQVEDPLGIFCALAADLGHGPVRSNEVRFVDPMPRLFVMNRRLYGRGDFLIRSSSAKEGGDVGLLL